MNSALILVQILLILCKSQSLSFYNQDDTTCKIFNWKSNNYAFDQNWYNKMYKLFFSQLNVQNTGAVVAAPDHDTPGGDYFFDWMRDGALSMRTYMELNKEKGYDFIKNNMMKYTQWVQKLQKKPDQLTDVRIEPKFNIPSGDPYTGGWCRPQTDGPSLRAYALIIWAEVAMESGQQDYVRQNLWNSNNNQGAINFDLDWVVNNWQQNGCDLWEEVQSDDFFWNLMSYRHTLFTAAKFARYMSDESSAKNYDDVRSQVEIKINSHYNGQYFYQSSNRPVDSAVIHALVSFPGFISLTDQRVINTIIYFNTAFCKEYSINQQSTMANQPGLLYGRYPGDIYAGGNPWQLLTSVNAEIYYLMAKNISQTQQFTQEDYDSLSRLLEINKNDSIEQVVNTIFQAGDSIMTNLFGHIKNDNFRIDEQIDRDQGYQKSAKSLTWSYANILRCLKIRQQFVTKMVVSVFRHGARESLNPEFLLPSDRTQNLGELTSVGMRQHFLLGTYMRQKYILDNKVIDVSYNASQIFVRSTNVNRTIMSALSQVQAIYPSNSELIDSKIGKLLLLPPIQNKFDSRKDSLEALPNNLQMIPVHTVPKTEDYLLLAYDNSTCPANGVYTQKQMNTQTYKKVYNDLQYLYNWTEQTFGYKFSSEKSQSLIQIAYVYDNFYVNKYKGKIWYTDNTTIIKDLKFNYIWAHLFLYFGTEEQLKLQNSKFFEELVKNMNNTINNLSSEKIFLYSAHDTTIMSLIRALNLTSPECHYQNYYQGNINGYKYCLDYPIYASNLQFELQEINRRYYVAVIYNGNQYNVCNNQQSDLCTFDEFIIQIQQKYYVKDFYNDCQIYRKQNNEIKSFRDATIALGVLFGIFFLAFIFVLVQFVTFKKKVQESNQINIGLIDNRNI